MSDLAIVIPMAGAGSRFQKSGYDVPKPFISFNGKMMVEHVLDGLAMPSADYILIIQKAFEEAHAELLAKIARTYPVRFVSVERLTQGAACTALAAHRDIDLEKPVVFADSDNILDNNAFRRFVGNALSRQLDGSLLTFVSDKPCFSYAEVGADGFVVRTKEKEVISSHAICGAYFFGRASDFVDSAIDMLIYGEREKGEYYMSTVFNRLLSKGKKVVAHDILDTEWNCVGTPRQLEDYLHG